MSGAVDEDVQQTVATGRAALGDMLASARSNLQQVFLTFVVGLLLTIWVLRAFVWNRLRTDLLAQAPSATVVAVTPFDVILLQVKIGIGVGVVLAIPLLIYHSRDALRARGIWPADHIPRWQLAVIGLSALGLFLGGIVYGYLFFFPLAFGFLAGNAVSGGFQPTYSIVEWAQFIILLSISFGLAAQLPLAMSGLAYAEIVSYETFRDYWKHAILGLYALGALFTPPDPLTQLMWATPLVVLYAGSLQLTKFVVSVKRGSQRVGARVVARRNLPAIIAIGLVAAALAYGALTVHAAGRFDPYLPGAPGPVRLFGLTASATTILVGVAAWGVGALAAWVYYLNRALAALTPTAPAPPSAGDPGDIDLESLDASGIRAAPPQAFAGLSEPEALRLASHAMDRGDHEKAQAILDRVDEGEATSEPGEGPPPTAAENEDEGGNVFTRTGANVLGAFTEEDTDDEEVGGYLFDIAFVLESVTSKAFWIVGVFMLVLAATFTVLYQGGIGYLKRTFLASLPEQVVADEVNIVALHPVEVLIFEIKVSAVLAFVATLPVFLYFAWPALEERGFARGNRNVLIVWGLSLFAGMILGSVIGFRYVAPAIISYLAADASLNGMVIAYRISNFGWLVFLTTVGVGLLADVPVSMFLFHRGGLVSYATMRRHWRGVTLGVFTAAALLSPRGVFTMFLVGIPVMLAYALGLGILWVYTLGGRRNPGFEHQRAD